MYMYIDFLLEAGGGGSGGGGGGGGGGAGGWNVLNFQRRITCILHCNFVYIIIFV